MSNKKQLIKIYDFDIIDGAALSTQDGSGIRFTTKLSSDMVALIEGHNISFATIIAINSRLGDADPTVELSTENDTAVLINSTKAKWTKDGDDTLYRAAIIGIPDNASAYVTQLAGRACMFVTYDDGTTATFYTDFDENNVRSMYDVAVNLTENGEGTVATEKVINTVKAASNS